MDIVLYTDLSIDECKERLNNSINTRTGLLSRVQDQIAFLLRGEQKPVRGKITENRFEIEKRKWYNAQYAPIFQGCFIENNTSLDTIIEGKYCIPLFLKVFDYILNLFYATVVLVFLFLNIRDFKSITGIYNEHLIYAVLAFSFLISLISNFIRSKRLVKDEEKNILKFIEKTLETKTE